MTVLVAALGGALLGAAGPVIAMIVQTRATRRTNLARMAVDAAIEEHRTAHEAAQFLLDHGQERIVVPPLGSLVLHHSRVVGLVDSGKLNRASLDALYRECEEVREFYAKAARLAESRPESPDA